MEGGRGGEGGREGGEGREYSDTYVNCSHNVYLNNKCTCHKNILFVPDIWIRTYMVSEEGSKLPNYLNGWLLNTCNRYA